MKALEILMSISMRDTKQEILEKVAGAKVEMQLMDITQVAAQLFQKPHNLRMRAINNDIGTVVGKVGRVYTRADVLALRRLIDGQTGSRPKTVKMKAQIVEMKAEGLSHVEIAQKLEISPSYIPKLLK